MLPAAFNRLRERLEGSSQGERTTGIEPATLSLGIGTRTAWLSGNPVTTQKTRRSEPLETAANGYWLDRDWAAAGRVGAGLPHLS